MKLHTSVTPRAGAIALWALSAAQAHAHDGHGLAGSHWHASDTWGFVAIAAIAAVVVWLSRNGK